MAFQPVGQPSAAPTDFNNDGKPDYLLYNASTHQTALWYLNNNVLIGHAFGPTLWPGWSVVGVADFNRRRSSRLPSIQPQYAADGDMVS